MTDDIDIRYEAEDVAAPQGRCDYCRRPFGTWSNDDLIVYKAFSTDSNCCTLCAEWERKEPSRRYDNDQKRRRK
jgi:hypothetical protein